MKWVTRSRIRVNRMATCWLIRRFLDPGAELRFVEPDQVVLVQANENAIGFDAPGATYPHRGAGGRCSFAALVEERLPDEPALREMARIVQAADFDDAVQDHPAAYGLRLISRGFPEVARDDHDTVVRATFLYDALYASIVEAAQS